ncbi:PAS domain-containing protein [Rhizobium sp. AC27/96]|uniref:PAS domain-containing protein n=1 Tax=Rhizobium sp. AC27/96 TaxID=1841653 RepID=UPI0008294B28|nr:PAS domain-containing protein [Rhizobium sp. AC27/96]OCJ12787.1 PAS domain-containing protein [Rhizobium sp. AC27/96]
MRQATSIEIFTYWERIRGDADAPMRNLIQPSAVSHILPELFILENTADDNPRFRLAGTAICNLMGREIRGENFAALWAGSQQEDPVRIAAGVMTHVVPALINATGYCISGRSMTFELVLMPLRTSGNTCDRLLGCLTPTARSAWLGNERLEFLALDRSRLLHDRPARLVDLPPHPDPSDLLPSQESIGLGEWMRKRLNRAISARNAGEIEPSRDKVRRRL